VSGKVPLYIRASGDALILEVVVTPRAKKTRMTGFHGGYPKIALAAQPVEGKANDELIGFFFESFLSSLLVRLRSFVGIRVAEKCSSLGKYPWKKWSKCLKMRW